MAEKNKIQNRYCVFFYENQYSRKKCNENTASLGCFTLWCGAITKFDDHNFFSLFSLFFTLSLDIPKIVPISVKAVINKNQNRYCLLLSEGGCAGRN